MTTWTNKRIPQPVQSLNGPLALALLCLLAPVATLSARPVVTLPPNSTGDQIQTALDGLSSGGEVDLPAGTIEVHKPIVLRHDNQTLRGAGAATILRLAAKANCPVVILGSPKQPVVQPTKQVEVADLVIDGNRTNQQKEFWDVASDGSVLNNNGIDIWAVDGATVERVVCHACRSGGLVAAQARHLEVRDYTAYDNEFDGLACYFTEQSHFSRLHLYDNLAAGISLDLSFQHNVIENAKLTGNDLGIFMRDSRDNVFEGLDIENSHAHGVFIAESGNSTPEGWKADPQTACTGNSFIAPVVTNCGGYGILINDPVSNGQYANNTRGGFFQAAAQAAQVLNLAMP